MSINIIKHNRSAWDREVARRNPATVPLPANVIRDARQGNLKLSLTGNRSVPPDWLPDLTWEAVIVSALSGGQQVPLLAAAGARVTALDNSPKQLTRDLEVAKQNGLDVGLQLGDMQDLSRFKSRSFEMAMLGMGLQFVPEPKNVWDELARVLIPRAALIAPS